MAQIEAAEAAEEAAHEAELEAEIARLEAVEEAESEVSQAYLHAVIDEETAQNEARLAAEDAKDQDEAAEKQRKALENAPTVERVLELRKVPTYSRGRVRDWGSVEEVDDEVSFTVDDVVTLWTDCVEPDNTFAAVELRGVLGSSPELQWLPDDAKIEIVELPKFAGQPADLLRGVKPMKAPEGSKGAVVTADGFHPLVWSCDLLFSPVQGWNDPETSVQVILCALNVAPDDGILRPQLLSALRARYARVVKDKDTYPPMDYPWRGTLEPDLSLLNYLSG